MREAHDPSSVASTTDDARRQFRSEAQNGAGQPRLRRCASPSHFIISAVLTRLALGLGGRGRRPRRRLSGRARAGAANRGAGGGGSTAACGVRFYEGGAEYSLRHCLFFEIRPLPRLKRPF